VEKGGGRRFRISEKVREKEVAVEFWYGRYFFRVGKESLGEGGQKKKHRLTVVGKKILSKQRVGQQWSKITVHKGGAMKKVEKKFRAVSGGSSGEFST